MRALEKLPKDSEVLDHAYKEAIERIEGQIQGFRRLANVSCYGSPTLGDP
jgi:hypothetical protein